MNPLFSHTFSPTQCRTEWSDLDALLRSKSVLSEQKDIAPFFKARKDLSLFFGTYFPQIAEFNVFRHEFQIAGDFIADLVAGDIKTRKFVLVEFEDGRADSVFSRTGRAKTGAPAWAGRFEGAYSQIIDWLWKLDDIRQTSDFTTTFGGADAKFQGVIVIGKDMNLSAREEKRLRWRADRSVVNSTFISCVSFNELATDFDERLKIRNV